MLLAAHLFFEVLMVPFKIGPFYSHWKKKKTGEGRAIAVKLEINIRIKQETLQNGISKRER